jgi:alkylhydroperoxidase family enzyme
MRVPRPQRDEVDDDVAAMLDLVTKPDGEQLDTVVVLAHQPPLMAPFLGWAAALALQGVLPKRDHELLALRTAVNFRSTFEWDEHVEYARQAGITDAELDVIARPSPAIDGWPEHERWLIAAADELHAEHAISDATWQRLADHYDTPALVEIPYIVGQYAMLSMVANSIDA